LYAVGIPNGKIPVVSRQRRVRVAVIFSLALSIFCSEMTGKSSVAVADGWQARCLNKMLSCRRETALQGALVLADSRRMGLEYHLLRIL